LVFLVLCLAGASIGWSAIVLGPGPTFSYTYSPRLSLGLDTNALNVGVGYMRESPANFNCSYIVPASSATPASGTVTYEFRPDAGYVIDDLVLIQRVGLFTTGSITGEYSADGGPFQVFYITPAYPGTSLILTKQIRFHHLIASTLTVRYTILRTGSSRSVQFIRDCDDVPGSLTASGTILSQAQANHTRGLSIINQGSSWKYLDDGSNQGTAWRGPNFNDSAWRSGFAEFGYGDKDETTTNQFGPDPANKYVTTYFRHTFLLTNDSPFKRVMLGLLRDDGGVAYLNGREVFKSNMPLGTIVNTTFASSSVDGANEAAFYETSVNPTNMIRGTNVLAVEIHQQRLDSSDISFDLDLWGELEIDRPSLQIERFGNCALLSWNAEGFILESAQHADGPWDPVLGDPTSPYSVCGFDDAVFFRLRDQP